MRRAKIVCTLGPATSTPERIGELVDAGLDVARLNLSHGSHAEHERIYRLVREAAEESGRGVGILVDLQGPKIRLGKFADGSVNLVYGDRFTITTQECVGDVTRCGTTYEGLPRDVDAGDSILVDDGRLALEVESVTDTDVVTRVVVGGRVSDHKGLNLPGVGLSVPALSEKDLDDLRWALHLRADMIALSFVRNARDVEDVRRVMAEEKVRLPVIAKIEKPQAVQNLDEIIDAFDGFMVARGDLGVEMPLEDVPLVQKRIVELARTNAKPVIVATQMLESMVNAPRPTRAEASDVANAVLDGTDAVMLSGETSVGLYPIDAVRTMARIVETTEEHGLERVAGIQWEPRTKGGVIAKAAAEVAERLGAKFLVAFTQSGDTARRLARYRSRVPLLAFTPEEETRHQLALTWGVETFLAPTVAHTDEMVKQVDRSLLAVGRCRRGDNVVIVAGSPPGIPGSTNALRVHRIGDAVTEAAPAYRL
ncbi:pyruvate kinase [Actinopolymorpha sp. B17G11]|uniref:pyruvate kinase n=1 Tax=unclassified Actinopolymorpha TaxID=2627063 RepID=UPI0032D9950C